MEIGIDHYTIAHRGLSAEETLNLAQERGLAGVQFHDATVIDLALRRDRLEEFRRKAEAMRMYLEVGIPSPNPVRRGRAEGRTITPEEHARDLLPHLQAVAALGCRHARAFVGDRHDRFRRDSSWADQQVAAGEVLRRLRPALRDLGLRIALENHADLTADELLAMIDAVGDDVMGVTLDTGNLTMRLDDPLPAAERLAPRTLTTHIKDSVLAFTPRGLCWQARPVGSGIVPIADILGLLHKANPSINLSIELHPRTYDLPIFNPTWLSYFPALTPAGLAAIVALAVNCEREYDAGRMPRPTEIEAIPWDQRDLDWLARSTGYLRPIVLVLSSLSV
jgi:sugar phosphate isomerase/epimerase